MNINAFGIIDVVGENFLKKIKKLNVDAKQKTKTKK